MHEEGAFLDRIITRDETWILIMGQEINRVWNGNILNCPAKICSNAYRPQEN
jgi:hypothetical protein